MPSARYVLRTAAVVLFVAAVMTGAPASVDAGILERVTTGMGYLKGLVTGGTDFIEEGMLADPEPRDFERRFDSFLGRQAGEGAKTFAEVVADGQARVTAGWGGLKGKLADTLVGKAAAAIKDKLWEAASSNRRQAKPQRAPDSRDDAVPAERARPPRAADASVGGPSETADAQPATETDDEMPETVGPGGTDEVGAHGHGELDPLMALHMDEDERAWLGSETGILDEGPLPMTDVSFGPGASAAQERGGVAAGSSAPAERDCDHLWDDCPEEAGREWDHWQHEGARHEEWRDADPDGPGTQGHGWQYAEDPLSDTPGEMAVDAPDAAGRESWQYLPGAEVGDARERDAPAWEDGAQGLIEGSDGSWDAPGADCSDVWDDCPPATTGRVGAQGHAASTDPWAGFDGAAEEPEAWWREPDGGPDAHSLFDGTAAGQAAADQTGEDYQDALATLLSGAGAPDGNLPPAVDESYRAALEDVEDLERQAAEKARIAAERAAARETAGPERHAPPPAQEEARQPDGPAVEPADPGVCGSAPACKRYIQHGEGIVAQVNSATQNGSMGMTDGALLIGLMVRASVGCMKKCMPHEVSDSCRSELQAAIDEFERSYRSAIENALSTAADSGYVQEFDRDPLGSRFLRDSGIHISGTSLDSCGD